MYWCIPDNNFFLWNRKLLSKTDDEQRPRNAVAGSNKKKHNMESDDEDISDDSDSSIHTSDMSSDEEEEKEVVQVEDQHTGAMILEGEEDIKSKKPETDSGCDEKMSEDSETIKSGDISVKTAEKKVMEHNPVLNIPVNRKADVQASYCAVLIVFFMKHAYHRQYYFDNISYSQ